MLKTPAVLMIVFNRPDHTKKVFDAVRKVKPERLYVAIDGARSHKPQDAGLIKQTLEIFEGVDWSCKVERLIRPQNLGCKVAVSSAITWFFESEEQGIILEDDCMPSASFFTYCAHNLERYKYSDSVMHISGVNFQDGNFRGDATYYFSKACHVWGWASWRRAWAMYDIEMENVDILLNKSLLKSIVNYKRSYQYWIKAYEWVKSGQIDTWDYQWAFSIWKNNGLCIAPNYNLISNIGFDETATHTVNNDPMVANKIAVEIPGEIKHCKVLIRNYEADEYSFKKLFTYDHRLYSRIKRKLKKYFLNSR